MTKLFCRQWQSAPTAAHGTFITPYVVNAGITEVSWQSRKTLPSNPFTAEYIFLYKIR
jgi:hypothetical protein